MSSGTTTCNYNCSSVADCQTAVNCINAQMQATDSTTTLGACAIGALQYQLNVANYNLLRQQWIVDNAAYQAAS